MHNLLQILQKLHHKTADNREEKNVFPVLSLLFARNREGRGRIRPGRAPVADDLQADLVEIHHLQKRMVEAGAAIEKAELHKIGPEEIGRCEPPARSLSGSSPSANLVGIWKGDPLTRRVTGPRSPG